MKSNRLWSRLLALAVMLTIVGSSAYAYAAPADTGYEGYTID